MRIVIGILVGLVGACATAGLDGGGGIDASGIDAPLIPVDAPRGEDAPPVDAPIDTAVDAACDEGLVELAINPGFDSGVGSWIEGSSGGFAIVLPESLEFPAGLPSAIDPIPSSPYAAWLGGYDGATDTLYQDIAIPSDASELRVSFAYRIESEDSMTTAYDNIYVELGRTDNSLLETVALWSNTDQQSIWRNTDFVASSPYAGTTVRVHFAIVTDSPIIGSDPTSFFVDSISVQARVSTCQ